MIFQIYIYVLLTWKSCSEFLKFSLTEAISVKDDQLFVS